MRLTRAKRAGLVWWGLCGFATAIVCGDRSNAQPNPKPEATPFEVASNRLQEAIDQGLAPGAALWFSEPGTDAKAAYFGQYHAETRISIGSSSQWLVAATLMTLVDDEKISLDEPISQFFPDLESATAALTLRQLLAHSSGLPAHHPCIANNTSLLAQCAQQILETSPSNKPGTEVRFGFGSFQIAGRIAEILTESSWEDTFQARLAKPLEMASTSFGDHSNPSVGTGASSTLEDYGKFLTELLAARAGRGKVLSARSAGEMLSNQMGDAVLIPESRLAAGHPAIGSWIYASPQPVEGERFSSPAIFGFTPWLEVSEKTAGIVLLLAEPDEARVLAEQIHADLTLPAPSEADSESANP
ncbi:MAG: beta-lactamase family protein [Deltaproteobacteria bacterium]|nr:beta-lactamase family protein [Deltaproteobacteria bacterium]